VLARGLAVGLGAIALVVGALAVFGDHGGRSAARAATQARNAEEIARIQSARPGTTEATAAPAASSTPGGPTGAAGAGATAPTTGTPGGAPAVAPSAPSPIGGGTTPSASAPAAPAPAAPAAPAPEPPTTTAPPPLSPWVTVSPGGGGVMVVSLGGFMPSSTYAITCKKIDAGVSVFGTDSVTTDGSGSGTSTGCVNPSTPPGSHEYAEVSGPGVPWIGSNHYQF
jgi:hypothetical protein